VSGSVDVERKIRVFSDLGDIIGAMKAYAGVAIRKTEGIIANIREYETNVLLALADVISSCAGMPLAKGNGAEKRLLVAFGSSQGLCGAYNEKLADSISALMKGGDSLYVIGRRLKSALDARSKSHAVYQESIAGVGGIDQAWRECISRLLELYRNEGYYTLTLVFTAISEKKAEISINRVLPPVICGEHSYHDLNHSPLLYLEPAIIFDRLLEQLIGISLYRGFVESLRSENWYRLRSMEGASENITRHITDLESLWKYLRQEEITGEMLEILGSGGFYRQ
jgi:F-type H+-transporting ATPase subunit gamma